MNMTYEQFITQTNIRDVVIKDFYDQFPNRHPTDCNMREGFEFYDKERQKADWCKSLKRELSFRYFEPIQINKSVQYDPEDFAVLPSEENNAKTGRSHCKSI